MQNTGLAVAIGLVSHFLNVLGMVLMKKAHLDLGFNANFGINYGELVANRDWLSGIVLMCIGGVLFPVSLGLGPITLTTALVVSSIPFNLILSHLLLTQKVSRTVQGTGEFQTEGKGDGGEEAQTLEPIEKVEVSDITEHLDTPPLEVILLSLAVCVSLGTAIAYAPPQSDWELGDDKNLWLSPEFVLWTIAMLGLVVFLWLGNKCSCGILHQMYGFKVAEAMIQKGIASAYVAILAKLAFASIEQGDDDRAGIYTPIFLALCVVPLEFPLRERCLASTDMTKALPTMTVCVMLFSVPTGGVFFKEFKDVEAENTIFFASLFVSGVIVLVMNAAVDINQSTSKTRVYNLVGEACGTPQSKCMPRKFSVPGLSDGSNGRGGNVLKKCLPTSTKYAKVDNSDGSDYTEPSIEDSHKVEIEMQVAKGTANVLDHEEPEAEPQFSPRNITSRTNHDMNDTNAKLVDNDNSDQPTEGSTSAVL